MKLQVRNLGGSWVIEFEGGEDRVNNKWYETKEKAVKAFEKMNKTMYNGKATLKGVK